VSVTSVVGLQWGDEAKGKIVDIITPESDVVVRYQGGNNAGHTVRFDGKTYKLSLLPAGILHDGVASVVATGVVINLKAFLDELDGIVQRNGSIKGDLLVSSRAHVVFPYHMVEEAVLENSRKGDAIGTTMRGIGTCYRDKASRIHAIRVGDLFHSDSFRQRLTEIVAQKNIILKALDPEIEPLDAAAIFEEYSQYAARLQPYVGDTTSYLHKALAEGKHILFEGAQGTLLDVDHGTFPYVTSSNSSAGGLHSGSGVSEREITSMIGVVKAYTTRVGGGPFPTELCDEIGDHLRDQGQEYGTVTGRPRRCGWFDAVAAGYSARLNGIDSLAIMLLDVLSKLEELKICEAYEINGEHTTEFPDHVEDFANVQPIYRSLPGWRRDISEMRVLADLPNEARQFVDTIEKLIGAPVELISVGADREQTIQVN